MTQRARDGTGPDRASACGSRPSAHPARAESRRARTLACDRFKLYTSTLGYSPSGDGAIDKSKTLAESVADKLAEEIVRRRLTPGTRLDEVSLAARFGVSRSPVRDALRLLAGTRLVDHRPRRGFCVAVVDQAGLQDLFEAAGEIEALCARLCALRASATERKRLQMVHQSTSAAAASGDATTYAALNEQLHQLIYAGSRNKTLAELALNMRHRLAPFRARMFFSTDNRMQGSNVEHDAIVRAIIARDADAAADAMLEHAAHSAMNVRTHLPRDDDSPAGAELRVA